MAELFSRHLDVRDLQTLGGAANPPPASGCRDAGGRRPISDGHDLELPRVVDVQMHFEGQTVMIANQPLHNVSTDLALRDGHLTLMPVFTLGWRHHTGADRGGRPGRSAAAYGHPR